MTGWPERSSPTRTIVPVSATTGDGLDDLRAALDVLVHETPAARRSRSATAVGRPVFAAKGSGTVVTGTLTGGALHTDQQVHVAGRDGSDSCRPVARTEPRIDRTRQSCRAEPRRHRPQRVQRGDAVIVAAQWRPTIALRCHAARACRPDHEVTRRGAYLAYIGSGEFPVKVRVLGHDAIPPGGNGLVRLHLADALPLVPGDRFVLRESGRDETVGGGEVLDVAPCCRRRRRAPTAPSTG